MTEPHRPDDDLITELIKDHREVEEYFDSFARADDPDEKSRIARDIISEIVRHSVAEEVWLYPTARKVLPDGDEIAEREIAEHAAVERLLKRIEGLKPGDPEFDATMTSVMTDIRDHVSGEERDLFPRLREACDDEQLRTLGNRVRRTKRVAPTHAHPSAPDRPPANVILGPLTGLVDRTRDALTRH